jgi:uncharacterized oligopeptide transporter (OPT) family protein
VKRNQCRNFAASALSLADVVWLARILRDIKKRTRSTAKSIRGYSMPRREEILTYEKASRDNQYVMEIAVTVIIARGRELLTNRFLILIAIPCSIICIVTMLCVGFFSVIAIIFNVQLYVVTGDEPGTGLDGMYIVADILIVAMVMSTFLLRYIRDDGDDDDDQNEEGDE